ncbi:MAG: hypothetical protein ACRD19_17235 [Terriglobia bacterium]
MKRKIPIQAIAALLVTAGVFITSGIPRFSARPAQPCAPTTLTLMAGALLPANTQAAEKSSAMLLKTASPAPHQMKAARSFRIKVRRR